MSELAIDHERMFAALEELSKINSQPDGSCCRIALTEADRSGRDLLRRWMTELDLRIEIDQIGNIFGTCESRLSGPIMMGSHIDTVRSGGKFDGAYGVVAGLEVIRALKRSGTILRRSLTVASFTNEEGVRFQPDMMGSLVHAGGLDLAIALGSRDRDGITLGDELKRIGYAGQLRCGAIVPHAYVELHIEQGPILHRNGIPLGAVENLQGISWQEISVAGQANHAGTTPMEERRDALQTAAKIARFVHHMALQMGRGQLATIGSFELEPGLINVVPAKAVMTVDLRNPDDRELRGAETRLADYLKEVAREERVCITTRYLARSSPVAFDQNVVAAIEAAATRMGQPICRMTSGAGHDAQMMARICPAAMIFVPSVDGVSHNVAEHTEERHLCLGAEMLLSTVLTLLDHDRIQ